MRGIKLRAAEHSECKFVACFGEGSSVVLRAEVEGESEVGAVGAC